MDVYVVTYDVADDKRRLQVAKILESHGRRLQYSVFWCCLGAPRLAQLRGQLDPLLSEGEDQVLFFHLGPHEGRAQRAVTWLGSTFHPPKKGAFIV